jgi:hypothetical protein
MDPEFIYESLITTARIAVIIIPLLFIFDFLNHRYGDRIESTIKKSRHFMPLLGAIFGLLPGCNVAVITAVFYAQGAASMGTLVAAMIATSDEALYVFIPLGFNFIPILVAKLFLAIVAGYTTDLIIKRRQGIKQANPAEEIDFCCAEHPHDNTPKKMLVHALRHGIRIITIVFFVLLALNFIQDQIKFETLSPIFDFLKPIQPLLLGLIGLIPGCGTSVGIATLYAKEIITFGAVVAGLSTASGEAIIVLLGQGVPRKTVGKIVIILLGFSVIFGFLLQYSNLSL